MQWYQIQYRLQIQRLKFAKKDKSLTKVESYMIQIPCFFYSSLNKKKIRKKITMVHMLLTHK